jgi:hypothetical protein
VVQIGSTIFKLPIGTERMTFFCAAAGMLAKTHAKVALITRATTDRFGQALARR